MNTARQHALEQANLITQLIKYADRVILVESASEPERRAFVKLLDEQLPDHIDMIGLRASPSTTPTAIIKLVSETLQLSPGIESPNELASAVHEALTSAERVLVIIENADLWKDKPQWKPLIEFLQAAHKLAPNQLLFLLTGDSGLADLLRQEPALADMQSDIHACQLLGEASPKKETTGSAAPTDNTSGDTSDKPLIIDTPEPGTGSAATNPPETRRRFSPTLLMAAGISVAVIAFGGFALLTRTTTEPVTSHTLPLDTKTERTEASHQNQSTQIAQANNPLPNDGAASTPALQGSSPTDTASTTAPAAAKPVPTNQESRSTPLSSPMASASQTPNQTANHGMAPENRSTASQITSQTAHQATQLTTTLPKAPSPEKPNAVIAHERPGLIPPRPQKSTNQPATATAHVVKKNQQPTKTHTAEKKPTKHKPTRMTAVKGTDNAWYRDRSAHRAAIQLGAFNDEKAALSFIRKHAASSHLGEWHLFSQARSGQVLYTVTAGDFANITEARKALSHLPATVQKLKPYPRTFASIRQVLKP